MTATNKQSLAKPHNLFTWLNSRYPGELFTYFTMSMILGVGGSLYLLRTFSDPYEALPVSGLTLLVMILAWGIALMLGAYFVFALGARPERRENPKILLLGAFLEVVILCVFTYQTFTEVPRTRVDVATIMGPQRHFTDQSGMLPLKVDEQLTITNLFYMGKMVSYNIDVAPGYVWTQKEMRERLLRPSCAFFQYDPLYKSVKDIVYVISSANGAGASFRFTRDDCVVATAKSGPAASGVPAKQK